MTLADIKAEARKAAFARRKAAHEGQSGDPAAQLKAVLDEHRGRPLSGYLPIRTEIDPRPAMAIAAAFGPVCVPVIQGKGLPLEFSRWTPQGPLREGPFGAYVPDVDDWIVPEVLIVPLVAFDASGGRLGYGGGFYDRTLERLRARGRAVAIGFAFDAQEADSLPLEPTDQPLDLIVTESRVLRFG
ncbi:5-formyltetrahydrofolate cyclo-ligase [Chachezhania antarctica]|uniref:5-formyltetrahydrofolate cyclo-ligase n=1 Tax=Chachezhania antarctica TaxID=2340860 RepID=UPI000EB5162A|nr:5-formyltetrahydrofolate cyclo-ligase [Chachezhania antarctica]